MKTAGLYIHIPFCEAKCAYCAFYSVADPALRGRYIDAVLQEAADRRQNSDEPWGEVVFDSLYIGGGTPSVLSVRDYERLFEALFKLFSWSENPEITFELNPEHRTLIADLKRHTPVNRLSIGIQSFRDERLKFMRRRHSGREAIEAVLTAKAQGFDNLSVDLIYGLPDMGADEWDEQLEQVADLNPDHLSAYALSVEKGSLLFKQVADGLFQMPEQETLFAQYEQLLAWAEAQGYEAYEVSNLTKKGRYSRHNSRYWDVETPYLGLGPGAHSFYRGGGACAKAHTAAVRRANRPDVKGYMDAAGFGANTDASATPAHPAFEQEYLSETDLYHEYVMTALRTAAGLDKARIAALPADLQADCRRHIAPLLAQGWLIETPTAYCPTPSARYRADGLALAFF